MTTGTKILILFLLLLAYFIFFVFNDEGLKWYFGVATIFATIDIFCIIFEKKKN
jgi:hypothetical protein